jgi:hypothetical protein
MKIHNEYLWLVLIVIVLIVGPLASIWALNTLFPVLAIPTPYKLGRPCCWSVVCSVAVSAPSKENYVCRCLQHDSPRNTTPESRGRYGSLCNASGLHAAVPVVDIVATQ